MRGVLALLREGWIQLVRSPGLTAAVAAVVAATLLQLSVALAVTRGFDRALSDLKRRFQMVVFLQPEAEAGDRERVRREIEGDPRVAGVEVLPREEALEQFRKDPEIGRLLEVLGENPLVDSLTVTFREDAPGDLTDFAARIERDAAVDEVVYGRNEWESVTRLGRAFRWGSVAVGTLLFAAALFVISNTFALALWVLREDLRVLERLGAPPWRRGGPLVLEGFAQGLLGALLLATGLEALLPLLRAGLPAEGYLPAALDLLSAERARLYALLFPLGAALGAGGAALAFRRGAPRGVS